MPTTDTPPDADIAAQLEKARRQLLDLGARNRLIHTPRSRTRTTRLDIVDELSEQVFRLLVTEGRSMAFVPKTDDTAPAKADATADTLDKPDTRYTDHFLQTALAEADLQKRLLKMFYDARTSEEEQGINTLYLALGFLNWHEAGHSEEPRSAPIVLIPVQLERKSAGSRFSLTYDTNELSTNLSLQEKLRSEFGITLPELPEAEDLNIVSYFQDVKAAIASQKTWNVETDAMVLWFFSFAKFLMFRDLSPDTWPTDQSLVNSPNLKALMRDGFRNSPGLELADDTRVDHLIHPRDLVHVLDADSSQTLAIEEVRRGTSLVIQGPPGTGKSQTITNLIAQAVKDGKRVLFVAEKMAALDVVKKRLEALALGHICLEVHSHKAKKQVVLQQIASTLETGRASPFDVEGHSEQLRELRDRLNGHAQRLHAPIENSGQSPFYVMGRLVALDELRTKDLDLRLPDASTWTRIEFESKKRAVEELIPLLERVGNPATHIWRGATSVALLPADLVKVGSLLAGISENLKATRATCESLADRAAVRFDGTFANADQIGTRIELLLAAPRSDLRGFLSSAWESPVLLENLVVQGERMTAVVGHLDDVADMGWQTDAGETRKALAAYGRSWWRFMNGKYRRARSTLRGILRSAPPAGLDDQLLLLDRLSAAQEARRQITSASAPGGLGAQAFGSLWMGEQSDWGQLRSLFAWNTRAIRSDSTGSFRRAAAVPFDGPETTAAHLRLTKSLTVARQNIDSFFKLTEFDVSIGLGVAKIEDRSIADLISFFEMRAPQISQLPQWTSFWVKLQSLQIGGTGPLVAVVDQGKTKAATLVTDFESAHLDELLRRARMKFPELAGFEGASHTKTVNSFQGLDRGRLDVARREVHETHRRGLPHEQGDGGEMGVLRREINKRRRHLPMRRLMLEAGRAIQAVKPVFMMSPFSVAQFLSPGHLHFDLLLMDEASQIRPVDAIGSIVRASQIVVVGDDKQLPPTQFFQKASGQSDDDDDHDDNSVGDLDSILDLARARGLRSKTLRWHYRSRHHSLIAVSNAQFYESRLFIPPSPETSSSGAGLKFRLVSGGVFDRGGASNNVTEAREVAKAIIEHARNHPEKSLGVGAFSVTQRDAILDELEVLRKVDPSLESFFFQSRADSFFVKNLENIQGDERDVIFISVGYGKDASGKLSMNFGPLNNAGGERRLNVLITRARELCVVFSSISADDIDLQRAPAGGVAALKLFLRYAASGKMDSAAPSGRDFDSEFEKQVASVLRKKGYHVEPQVGIAGFFIDLAILHPKKPGNYVLGIECDGAQYHSSLCARDRDRLRQSLLEDRGWTIHRIWSTDWFRDAARETDIVVKAIDAAVAAADVPAPHRLPPQPTRSVEDIGSIPVAIPQAKATPKIANLYQEANFSVPKDRQLHELSPPELSIYVLKVVGIEGPIHEEEVARRIATLWEMKRAGPRTAGLVGDTLRWLTRNGQTAERHEGFFMPYGTTSITVRNREAVTSASLKKPEFLPPAEINEAFVQVVRFNEGISPDVAIGEAARMFGFKTMGRQIRDRLSEHVRALVSHGELRNRGERLYSREAP